MKLCDLEWTPASHQYSMRDWPHHQIWDNAVVRRKRHWFGIWRKNGEYHLAVFSYGLDGGLKNGVKLESGELLQLPEGRLCPLTAQCALNHFLNEVPE